MMKSIFIFICFIFCTLNVALSNETNDLKNIVATLKTKTEFSSIKLTGYLQYIEEVDKIGSKNALGYKYKGEKTNFKFMMWIVTEPEFRIYFKPDNETSYDVLLRLDGIVFSYNIANKSLATIKNEQLEYSYFYGISYEDLLDRKLWTQRYSFSSRSKEVLNDISYNRIRFTSVYPNTPYPKRDLLINVSDLSVARWDYYDKYNTRIKSFSPQTTFTIGENKTIVTHGVFSVPNSKAITEIYITSYNIPIPKSDNVTFALSDLKKLR